MPRATKLTLVLSIPGWTPDELRLAVHAIDALDDEVPIAIENVRALDVLHYVHLNQIGVRLDVIEDTMELHDYDPPESGKGLEWDGQL